MLVMKPDYFESQVFACNKKHGYKNLVLRMPNYGRRKLCRYATQGFNFI